MLCLGLKGKKREFFVYLADIKKNKILCFFGSISKKLSWRSPILLEIMAR